MRSHRKGVAGAMLAAVAILATSCSSGGSSKAVSSATTAAPASSATTASTAPTSNESVTIASFNFGESEILANMYADVLKKIGVSVTLKDKLGSREVVEPALQSGQVDLVPEYVGTVLEFLNKNAGEASSDLTATVAKLRTRFTALNITVLDPSPAADQNAFAVSKATADKDHLTKTSDVAQFAAQWTLGGPPECPTRPFCQPGLAKVYGLNFKSFKSLDAGGPLTETAIANGQIDMGLVFSSDGGVAAKGLVVLEDDKHLQTVDNIVPVMRTTKAVPAVTAALNGVSAALTTDELVTLNKMVDVDKADPSAVALTWLKSKGLA